MRALRRAIAIAMSVLAGSWALSAQAPAADNKGAWALLLLLPVIGGVLQLAFAALFPRAVRGIEAALRQGIDSTIGWGVLFAVLIGLVGAVLGGMGGQAGQVLGGLIVGIAVVVAMVAGSGAAAIVGSWALARDNHAQAPTFLRVAAGALLLGFAVLVPLVGWLVALALAVLSLGAAVRCAAGIPPVQAPAQHPSVPPAGGDAPCGSQ